MTLHSSCYLWLFLTFTLSHIAAQLFAIAIRPWVIRKPAQPDLSRIAKEAAAKARGRIGAAVGAGHGSLVDDIPDEDERPPVRDVNWHSGVKAPRTRR